MALLPEEFLTVASDLHAGIVIPATEGRHRSVGSRAYYSVYLQLRQELRAIKGDLSYNIGHGKMVDWLGKSGVAVLMNFAEELRLLRGLRFKGDYRVAESYSLNDAKFALVTAKSLHSRLASVVQAIKTTPVELPTHEPPAGW